MDWVRGGGEGKRRAEEGERGAVSEDNRVHRGSVTREKAFLEGKDLGKWVEK